jgi:flagellar FliJ protein
MARFLFRLEAVLDHRRALEREHQRAVAAVERERAAIEATIRAIHAEIAREKGEVRACLSARGVVELGGVRARAADLARLHAEADRHVLRLAGVMKRLDAARAELLAAARRRRAVELLRERRFEEWKLEQSRRETAAVDEIGVMRSARDRVEGAWS